MLSYAGQGMSLAICLKTLPPLPEAWQFLVLGRSGSMVSNSERPHSATSTIITSTISRRASFNKLELIWTNLSKSLLTPEESGVMPKACVGYHLLNYKLVSKTSFLTSVQLPDRLRYGVSALKPSISFSLC